MKTIAALLCLLTLELHAQQDPARAWDDPVEPFRIAGNLYYVGAWDLASFLLTSPQGHILIDGGSERMAPQILANIAKLGFRAEDVRLLLNTHAHADHAGGLEALRRATGARLLVSREDTPLIARGGADDPQFGNRFPFTRTYPDGLIADRQQVQAGHLTLTAHHTPGHTQGCTTWETNVREGGRKLNVVIVCSVSVPTEYRLRGNPRYPNAADDYRRSFARLHTLTPDIFLGSHGIFFGLQEKIRAMRENAPRNPFIDAEGYRKFVETAEERFRSRLAAE